MDRDTTERNKVTPEHYFASSDMYQVLGYFMVRTEPEVAQALYSGDLIEDVKNILEELNFEQEKTANVLAATATIQSQYQDADALFHAVRKDYTHLFANPKFSVSSPYERRFHEGEKDLKGSDILLGKTVQSAAELYRKAGFESEITPALRADHIAVELEFMQILRRNQGIALQAGDTEVYNQISLTAQEFVSAHLSQWVINLYKDIEEKAEEDVYRFVGALGRAFFEQDV